MRLALRMTPIEKWPWLLPMSSMVNSQNARNWSMGVSHSTVPPAPAPSAHSLWLVRDTEGALYFWQKQTLKAAEEEAAEVVDVL